MGQGAVPWRIVHNISDIVEMRILNSKAYYLKNYPIRTRSKTESKQPIAAKQDALKLKDIIRIRNIKDNRTLDSCMPRVRAAKNCKLQTIYEKQQQMLLKLCRFKQSETRHSRWHSESVNKSISIEKHPLAQINSIQFESMKPTNRYFHDIENIRLAQKLLLAKPSRDINRTSQQKFFQQQETYKLNISKLSFRAHDQHNKKNKMHRKKWTD